MVRSSNDSLGVPRYSVVDSSPGTSIGGPNGRDRSHASPPSPSDPPSNAPLDPPPRGGKGTLSSPAPSEAAHRASSGTAATTIATRTRRCPRIPIDYPDAPLFDPTVDATVGPGYARPMVRIHVVGLMALSLLAACGHEAVSST